MCGRKKLPFAEYSVVKERLQSGLRPEPSSVAREALAPLRSLTARFARRRRATHAEAKNFSKTANPVGPGPTTTNQVGEYRARTGDLLVANQALSQLS